MAKPSSPPTSTTRPEQARVDVPGRAVEQRVPGQHDEAHHQRRRRPRRAASAAARTARLQAKLAHGPTVDQAPDQQYRRAAPAPSATPRPTRANGPWAGARHHAQPEKNSPTAVGRTAPPGTPASPRRARRDHDPARPRDERGDLPASGSDERCADGRRTAHLVRTVQSRLRARREWRWAGAAGLEPATSDFGDRRSAN